MRALFGVLLLATSASAAEVVGVESDGVWTPGAYTSVTVKLDGTAESVRVRLGEGRESEAERDDIAPRLWRASILPRADVSAVEIDTGSGWKRHPLVLRRSPIAPLDVLPDDAVISRVLFREILDVSVPSTRVKRDLKVGGGVMLLTLAWIAFARGRGWRPWARLVGPAVLSLGAVALLVWPAPVSIRSVGISSLERQRTWDAIVLSGRERRPSWSILLWNVEPDVATVRPLADPDGRWPDRFTVCAGGHLADLRVGGAFRRYALFESERAWSGPFEDAFWSLGQEAIWIGRTETIPSEAPNGPRIPITEALDRVVGARGTVLRRIGRPALRPGLYGFVTDEDSAPFYDRLRVRPTPERLERYLSQ